LTSNYLVAAWTWSGILVVVTIVVHVCGIASMAAVVPKFWKEEVSERTFLDTVPGSIVTVSAIALLLAILHCIESLIWAVVYVRLGVQTSIADAMLYSLGAMSTAGSGLNVNVQWRPMSAVESLDGVLLFGISTAFLFSMIKFVWRSF
jgi:hypothetical protein